MSTPERIVYLVYVFVLCIFVFEVLCLLLVNQVSKKITGMGDKIIRDVKQFLSSDHYRSTEVTYLDSFASFDDPPPGVLPADYTYVPSPQAAIRLVYQCDECDLIYGSGLLGGGLNQLLSGVPGQSCPECCSQSAHVLGIASQQDGSSLCMECTSALLGDPEPLESLLGDVEGQGHWSSDND